MKRVRFKPLVWPVSLLGLGVVGGWMAEIVVGRWQDYQLYSLTRPVADLLLITGAVWLMVAVVSMVRGPRS